MKRKSFLFPPETKSHYHAKHGAELSLLSTCFTCLKSAFPLQTALPSVGIRNQGKATGLPWDNKEKRWVRGGLGTHASLHSVFTLESAGDEALGKQVWRSGMQEKPTCCLISQKTIIFLPALPLEAVISDPWDKTQLFSVVLPLLTKLCSCSGSSAAAPAAVFTGAQGGAFPSSFLFLLLLTTLPANSASTSPTPEHDVPPQPLVFYLFSIAYLLPVWGIFGHNLIRSSLLDPFYSCAPSSSSQEERELLQVNFPDQLSVDE